MANEEELRKEILRLTLELKELNDLKELLKSALPQYFSGKRKLPCVLADGSRASASISKGHKNVDFVEQKFGLLEICNVKNELSTIFTAGERIEYSTEMDLSNLVYNVLFDMVKIANLECDFKLRCDLAIASLRADIWVIYFNGCPVGAVAIKRPRNNKSSRSIFRNSQVQGQLFDYLLHIRSFHGLRHVFGIITDFEDWRICWLPDSDEAAHATDLSYSLHPPNIDVGCAPARVMHGSEIYSGRTEAATPLLATALVSVLRKIDYGRKSVDVLNVQLLSDQRLYICLNRWSWSWTCLRSFTLRNIRAKRRLSLVPPASNGNFILLRDYHGGADGRVWLAASTSGNLAVIKFIQQVQGHDNSQHRAAVTQEVAVWRACGISSVFSCTLYSRSAIVMPFSFHCRLNDANIPIFITSPDCRSGAPTDDASTCVIEHLKECQRALVELDPCDVLRECVDRMATANYVHEDIEWRHVSVTPIFRRHFSTRFRWQFEKFVCTFIDNGRVSKVQNKTEAAVKMQPRVEELMAELPAHM